MATTSHHHAVHFSTPADPAFRTTPNIADLWDLDTIGIQDPTLVSDDDIALTHFNNTVQFHNGRYEVSWPWKSSNPDLPDNFTLTAET